MRLFAASLTQTRRGGQTGTAYGFDYAGVGLVAQWMGIDMTETIADLQVMEMEAVKAWMN